MCLCIVDVDASISTYSNKCVSECSGHSLVFWHHWVINIISQHGCDQSLWLKKPPMFTIPACVLNSRPDQPTNIKGCFALSPILSLSLTLTVSPLSPSNFLFFIQLHLISLRHSRWCGTHAVNAVRAEKTQLWVWDVSQCKCFPYAKILIQKVLQKEAPKKV